jgi:hypothetical protein
MPHKIMYCPTFERNFKDFFKSYPKSIGTNMPILMFKKGRYKQESKMFADAKYALKGILSEIKKNLCSESIVILPLDK